MWKCKFRVRWNFRNQNIFRAFFQVRRENFSKFLDLKFLFLLGLSNCTTMAKSFSYAFFRDSRMQNLKMFRCQNFCLPLIYLDNEFHQNRLNPFGSQFFQVDKIPVPFDNFENVNSGTSREIFKILGFEIRSFSSTIELHYNLANFF